MKKVTAYESNNGRLFHTEAECLKYETKMAKYPKIKHIEEVVKEETFDHKIIEYPIVKHTQFTWEKPNCRRTDIWYIVKDKYKVQFHPKNCFNHTDGYIEEFWMKDVDDIHTFVHFVINGLIKYENPFSFESVVNMSNEFKEEQLKITQHWDKLLNYPTPSKDYVPPYVITLEKAGNKKYKFNWHHQIHGKLYDIRDRIFVEKIS